MSRDAAYLAKLQDYYAEQGVFPPYSGIGRLLGLRSKSSVAACLGRLREAGYLDTTESRRLKPGERFFERPLRAAVRAGRPDAVEDAYQEASSLDRYLIDSPSRTVHIEVRGESMTGAGILSGDLAVVELDASTQAGDLVVARVDGEFTLKRLALDADGPVLEAAHPDYADIRPRAELDIVGVVRGIVRRYPGRTLRDRHR